MNFTRFINSRDIAKYLDIIGYEFSPLEAAWLIWQCHSATLREKHEAWQEIIDTMPDCDVHKEFERINIHSLRELLKSYIDIENYWVDIFTGKIDNTFYEYDIYYKDRDCIRVNYFSTYEEVLESMRKNHNQDVDFYRVYKKSVGTNENIFQFVGFKDFEIESINAETCDTLNEREKSILDAFRYMYFDFPTPFKKGDVVCFNSVYQNDLPFVMTDILTSEEINGKCLLDMDDEGRMCIYGYFLGCDGNVYTAMEYNYMDVEFYRGVLEGKKRVLKTIYSYLKGHIDLCLFACAYHQILCEEYAKECIPNYDGMSLSQAGIYRRNER